MSKYPVEMKAHLDGAITTLRSAKDALAAGQTDVAASRAAESVFHTGSMLLLDEEVEPGSHGDVIPLLQEIFVQGRRLTKEQGANLEWLFSLRNTESRPVTSEEATRAVEIAENFFEAAKIILEG